MSPKYHCEIAGEGIEYAWGLAKKKFRHTKLEDKNTKEKFNKAVKASINHVKQDHVFKFAAKCRRIMVTYLAASGANRELTYESIEKFQKKLKTHRNVSDQEKGYISQIWKESVTPSTQIQSATNIE